MAVLDLYNKIGVVVGLAPPYTRPTKQQRALTARLSKAVLMLL